MVAGELVMNQMTRSGRLLLQTPSFPIHPPLHIFIVQKLSVYLFI
jgi:hypothetical protein